MTTGTTYILVPGLHTGGWVWQEVADRLREAGARARAVTLSGLGAGAAPAGPGTDLAAHVAEVVAHIDAAAVAAGPDRADIVLVGHCYGAHVAMGAADLRPGRVSRIVLVDTAPAGDGDTALALAPDAPAHANRGAPLPVPGADGWQRRGSTAGVPARALERLTGEGSPQPPGTLTQPLRLSGAADRLPATGVLCTGNGAGIETVEALIRMGDPRFRPLADPRLTYFELATGHWPMLSEPAELARVLLRAAAGEGHRMTAAAQQPPAHLGAFLLDVPERPRERVGHADLYLPDAEQPAPAVVFVHGGPVHPGLRPTPRDWPVLVGYGRYAAQLGAVGVTLDHRLYGMGDFARAADDVAEAVALVRADPRVDADRVALWCFSAGALLAADRLAAPPPWLRCLALSYPVLAPLPNWGVDGDRFRPARAVRGAGRLPVVLTRVERERPEIAATVAEFLDEAARCAAAVTVFDVPGGRHGFESTDRTRPAREAVRGAIHAVLEHLAG